MIPTSDRAILCFGELLLRLSAAPGTPFADAAKTGIHVGGAEANVGAFLAQLGHNVEMVTALPTSLLGNRCVADLHRYAVGTRHVVRATGRLGLYFLEQCGPTDRVIYDREQSVFVTNADSFDWAELAGAARWFHVSGINLALGRLPSAAVVAATTAMNEAGVPVSFDVNYRPSLWEKELDRGRAILRTVASTAQVLFANATDLSFLLDLPLTSETSGERRRAAEAAFEQFDRLDHVASTRRTFIGGSQQLSARVDSREGGYETSDAALGPVIDRIGSGDAFAGAVIDQLLGGNDPQRCATIGLSAAIMKHRIAGDRWSGSREDVETFDAFSPRDIRR